MKKYFLLGLVLLSACQQKDIQKPADSKALALSINQSDKASFASGDVSVKVLNIEDSRCPMNANCIHLGWARVSFSLTAGGEEVKGERYFGADAQLPKNDTEIKAGGRLFEVTVQEVTPYPCTGCPNQPASQAVLNVKEK